MSACVWKRSRTSRSCFLAALAAAFLSEPLSARSPDDSVAAPKVFYVAPGTNTLTAARDAVREWRANGHSNEAATIRLPRGEYLITDTVVLDARDGNVTWVAAGPASTFITGGGRITKFKPDNAGLWRAQTNLRFEQAYVDGRRATRSRTPAEGFFNIESVKQEEEPDNRARLTIKVPQAAITSLAGNDNALPGMQLLVFHKWDTSRYAIESINREGHTITVQGAKMQPWNPWDTQSRFILENTDTPSTEAGAWRLDQSGELTYHPRPEEKIADTEFVAPAIERILEMRGAANIHFEGIRFEYAGWRLPPQGCPPAQAAAGIDAAIQIDDAQGVTFKNCEVAHTGTYGVWFRNGCRGCRIDHCLFEDLGAGAIRIGEMGIRDNPADQTEGIVVDNSIIRGCGRVHPSAVGVWIGQSANDRITHNDISDTFYTGISIGWTWGYGRSLATNNLIAFNRIHRIGQGALSDMGGIYTLGVSPGSACVGNVIYGVRAHDYGGWGIYPDEGSTGWRIESNLVWNCTCVNPSSGGAFHQHYGATNYIANNIFALSSGPPMQATRVEDHLSFTLEHNLIVSSNAAFFTGPWDKIQFASRNNCFAYYGAGRQLFPNGDLASWQNAGHDTGSTLTNLQFTGNWPDVMLPADSPAFGVGFKPFDPKVAGVYGDRIWIGRARQASEVP